ncbi:MAG: hypothetical protein IT455_21820 [Planctomycetes bacterium]|nr:hypothetical protein [Planctomycetota bacterium]
MRRLPAVACCVALLGWPLPAQAPTVVAGDVAQLQCRVLAVETIDDHGQVLTVEVDNRGAVAAEPLAFDIQCRAKQPAGPPAEPTLRAQLPHVARFGRPVAPGGKQSYRLRTALAGKKGQFAVQVTTAAFCTGNGEVQRPALGIGAPEQVQRTSLVGTFPVTKVTLTNPLPQALDVVLRVTFEQPRDCVDLIGVRLEAGAARDLVLCSRPATSPFLDLTMEAPATAVKATKFELVDWCLVGEPAADAADGVLRGAYTAWYRWPDRLPVSGSFTFRERRARLNDAGFDDHLVQGRFELPTTGAPRLEITAGGGANASLLLGEAFANVRRPDFDELGRQNRLRLVTPNRVALAGRGWFDRGGDAADHRIGGGVRAGDFDDLEVRDGRIVSEGRGDGERTSWQFGDCAGRSVVTRRRNQSTDTRFSYSTVAGLVVPTAVSSVIQFGDKLFTASELVLEDLRFDGTGALAVKPPTGDGEGALRTIWDAAWHLPTAPLEIEAKFTVTTGNDGVWRGRTKFRGSIVMTGIGRNLRRTDCRFEGNLAREDEVQLAAVLRDRFGIWTGRDFNDRLPFDEYFAGATIDRADASGTFRITGGPIDTVETQRGQVRAFGWRGGSRRFTYGKVGEHQVVTRIDEKIGAADAPSGERWEATTTITFTTVGDLVLPTKFVFERIFGRDWTPETITLTDLVVRQ